MTDVGELTNTLSFGIEDYIIFIMMLLISALIGVYFGYFAGDNSTTEEYLLGGKQMRIWPVAISLIASQLSGVSLVAMPAEIYNYGVTFAFLSIAVIIAIPLINYGIIPVYYINNISNCYEYLELRFNGTIRHIVTLSFVITVYLLIPVLMFLPSLSFSQVTGINVHLINSIACFTCVFYTMLGGVKAVIWTDVFQAMIMCIAIVIVVVMGVINVGGLSSMVQRAYEGGRLDISFDLDPRTRNTFWNCMLGGTILWTSYSGFNQSYLQRIRSLPSLEHARRSLHIFQIGYIIIVCFNLSIGIIMYAKYYDCDPIAWKVVEKADKLVPYFVQNVIGHWKGISGLFISCIFSAALSTISASLNALAGIVYLDYMKPYISHSERKANLAMKSIVSLTGLLCIPCGFVIEKAQSILHLLFSVSGLTYGAVFGVFMLGLFIPRAHSKPVLISLAISIATMMYITFRGQGISMTSVYQQALETRIDGCTGYNASATTTMSSITQMEEDQGFSIRDISFQLYGIVGALVLCMVAIPLSYVLPADKELNPDLLSPLVKKYAQYHAVNIEITSPKT